MALARFCSLTLAASHFPKRLIHQADLCADITAELISAQLVHMLIQSALVPVHLWVVLFFLFFFYLIS